AIFSGKMSSDEISTWNDAIVTVCDSTERMAKERTGALIVIEMETSLGEIVRTGTKIDAAPTCELLETIFYEGTPLHDGAVVIRNGRVEAAGCLLPVSQNTDISRDMGTRHRAALGMSENSDAIIVVVSEESGIISIAQNGLIVRRLDKSNLFRILQNEIMPQPEEGEETGKGFLGRFKKK
ncbi:MAG: DNA integrity scanning protein DisA nucleotide-binding domain protein, partial [Oscillospiraceae bacterium]